MPSVRRQVWSRALSLSPILILQSPVLEMLQTTAGRRGLATKDIRLVPSFVVIGAFGRSKFRGERLDRFDDGCHEINVVEAQGALGIERGRGGRLSCGAAARTGRAPREARRS